MAAAIRVLVVDDSEAEREIMGHTLSAAFVDADVHFASNPKLVEKLCETDRFDCVMLDYNMPEMDGLQLALRLRAGNSFLPIILVTNAGDEMLAAEALRDGISDYIPKSRATRESVFRTISRAILVCEQAKMIAEQRHELETFAYALAHDFKQPVRQIITFSELIEYNLEKGGNDEVKQHLDFLSGAAARLGNLVDVMTQYTLLNQPPEVTDVDLNTIFDTLRESLKPFLAECGGELILSSSAPMILANETLMIQVLQNLIVNGFLYNRNAHPHVEVSFERDGDKWIVNIRDDGIGIDPEYLSEIFKPLIRLHNASEFPGTGLGLTLARKAVLAQNGAIWCESISGSGSVFHIRMRAAG